MNFSLFYRRFHFTAGSLLSSTILMVLPCHADKDTNHGDFVQTKEVTKILYENCYACHDEFEQEGDIRLDQLGKIELGTRLNVLNKMQEQLHFTHMPPKEEKSQPTEEERAIVLKWAAKELKKHNASKLEDKLRMPEYANFLDHDKLFSGKYKDLKPFTPDRRWLISEYIFDAKYNKMLNHKPTKDIDGKRHPVLGENAKSSFSLTNPFLLPTNTGVRYYANTTLNGGHLLTMLTNSQNAAIQITDHIANRDKRYIPAYNTLMEQEYKHDNILASRKRLLDVFSSKIIADIYGDKNQSLLPKFKSVAPERPAPELVADKNKPAINYGGPGKDELAIIFRTMRRQEKHSKTEDELLLNCEKEWFYNGHNPRKISGRIKFFHYYMKEWADYIKHYKFDQRQKQPVYKPLNDAEMKIIKDTVVKFRKKGDTYQDVIDKCMAHWSEALIKERDASDILNDKLLGDLVSQSFQKIIEREPTDGELTSYKSLALDYLKQQGNHQGFRKLLQTMMLRSDFVYRQEFGHGAADEHGRRMLSPHDASFALSYALTDSSPDEELQKAAKTGKLNTREDYKREVTRMLKKRDQYTIIDNAVVKARAASITNLPIRKLRFFREFFGYPKMLAIFKDAKRFGGHYDHAKGRLVDEADMLVEHILKKDKNVIETLLNTEDFYVFHSGDNEAMEAHAGKIYKIYHYFKEKGWEDFKLEDLNKHSDFLGEVQLRNVNLHKTKKTLDKRSLDSFKRSMKSFTLRFAKGQKSAPPYNAYPSHGHGNAQTRVGNYLGSVEVAKFFNIPIDNWDYPATQPAKMKHRKGILTHPAWLIAHAQNTETDPVIRGKWVQEKLLAGTIPHIPITVEAVVPEDHHKTLRLRHADVTEKKYCWKCHVKMNPLGYPFEMYDDFGRFRTEESIEHPENLIKKNPDKGQPYQDLRDIYKTLPVNSEGRLTGTGDEKLDGKVKDAIDLADRLSRSDRVRQSIIRHAFRYFMGRNEFLSDSKTLIDADKAYLESGGSFDAVIVSLLTSDSFIYRKENIVSQSKN
ncbi:MAG: hypothetical protein ACI9E1_001660 [Cryomorphaceae bacterium]|jgi:hypothetical protein